MMCASMPLGLVSVNISTAAPSGMWPYSCFLTKEVPFFWGACAKQANVRVDTAMPANRARRVIKAMVLPTAASVPFAAAQAANIDHDGDHEDQQVDALYGVARIHFPSIHECG